MKPIPSGDQLASVSTGQPVQLTAATWNALMQMLRDGKFNGPQRTGGGPVGAAADSPTTLFVKNTTENAIAEFGVMQLEVIAIEPADNITPWRSRRVMLGIEPTATTPFGIVQEPISAGQIGRAVVVGVTPAILNVVDVDHQFAGPTTSTTELTTSTGGPARILWKETGTGAAKKAVVLLFGSPNSQRIRIPTCIAFRVSGSSGG